MEHTSYPVENVQGMLILFHGSGDEHTLLPISKELSDNMEILAFRAMWTKTDQISSLNA